VSPGQEPAKKYLNYILDYFILSTLSTFLTYTEDFSYLPNRVHLEELRSFVGDTHLKVLYQLNLDAAVFRGN